MLSGILGWAISLSAYGWRVVHQHMAWGHEAAARSVRILNSWRNAETHLWFSCFFFFFENLDSPVSTCEYWQLDGFPNSTRHTVAFSSAWMISVLVIRNKVRISSEVCDFFLYQNWIVSRGLKRNKPVCHCLVFTIAQFVWRQTNHTQLSHEIGLFRM